MSTLTKKEIVELIKEEKIVFEPELDQFQLQPNSIDLRAGWNYYVPKTWEFNNQGRVVLHVDYLDTAKKDNYKIVRLKEGQYFEILPGEFIIVSTLEKIKIRTGDIMAILLARSSMTRRGLVVEGGSIDSWYKGYLMIPVKNNTSNQIIRIYPGERICQLILSKLSSDLSEEEASVHGVSMAKYLDSTPYGLEARTDSEEEVNLVKKGNISKIKKQFKIA